MIRTGMIPSLSLTLETHGRETVLLTALMWVIHLVFGAFPAQVLGTIAILVFADWILGMARAFRCADVRYSKAVRGLVKIALYMALLALTTLLARTDLGQAWRLLAGGLISFVGALVILTESISVLLHLKWFADQYQVTLPVLDALLRRLQDEADKQRASR